MPSLLIQLKKIYYASTRNSHKPVFVNKANGLQGFEPNEERYNRAKEMRERGHTYKDIGKALGITDRGAWNLLNIPRAKRR